ncbi:hypothetical protein SLE2022_184580 [Rubroshorea leprosula]
MASNNGTSTTTTVNRDRPESNLPSQSLTPAEAVVSLQPRTAEAQAADEVNDNQGSEEGGETEKKASETVEKWPGWPGYNVFRLIVPVGKVGSIIGRKGELIKKMCDETRARIRILEAPVGTPDRIVLISGKEEPDAQLPPATDAAVRVFRRVSGLSTLEGDDTGSAVAGAAFCSIKLLVASSQAINLIGKQGSTIKSIQESTGATVRILAEEELPSYATSEERLVDIHGEAMKVLKALEAVLGQLRKFLVDHTVIPIFEKTYNAQISQERPAAAAAAADTWADRTQPSLHSAPAQQAGAGIASDYSLSLKRDPLYERESHLEPKIPQSVLPLLGDRGLGGVRSTGLSRTAAPIVTQMTQTMQVPLSYAEDIIGIGGSNIAYIRRTSGAILTIQESGGLRDEITVEIKGTTTQVQMAQMLIQEFITNHKEPTTSVYDNVDTGLVSYSQLPETNYRPSYSSHLGGGYGSSDVGSYGSSSLGGYSSYRY